MPPTRLEDLAEALEAGAEAGQCIVATAPAPVSVTIRIDARTSGWPSENDGLEELAAFVERIVAATGVPKEHLTVEIRRHDKDK